MAAEPLTELSEQEVKQRLKEGPLTILRARSRKPGARCAGR